ncbi:signal peptide peptidase SppA [Pontibacillus yanchengensis]|uniref:Signal peptide peptidase SppA n=2 Tax=Pontibacillus yanchengensis TaxID=462910 RepID=A0ACC7VKQ6_9BACI|nr:signal peptide peptidase SppA [Pontibacillus yanchengensis]MYL36079.1 signal peptide peptidase SppA [Pontibacillus yanchengensis]MYL55566.1 signal peptide peptidase SppA [Pontibacillus yanchengensis]
MSKRIVAILIAAALLIFAILTQSIGLVMSDSFSESRSNMLAGDETPKEKVVERGSAQKRIARISVEGTILSGQGTNPFNDAGYNHERLLDQLEAIKKDNTIKGVLLYVNSPGGGVFESAQIHKELLELKEAGKKLYVSMGSMAASGGYYISTPADQIYASKQTLTGSLGVIMQSVNYKELANEYGVKFNTIKSGEFKDIMSPTSEMTQEDRDILQSLVDDSYQDFVNVIKNGRDMSESKVKDLADGRIYSGKQALDNGLIDELGFEEDALSALKEEIGGDPQVFEFKPRNPYMFGLPFNVKSFLPNSEVKWIQEMIQDRQGPTMMYLYTD